tara:strand:- start:864 stop:1958 length:1095 start_codon:yes stop_codon:yes gene_type:complete
MTASGVSVVDFRSDFASPPSPAILDAISRSACSEAAFGFKEDQYACGLEAEAALLLGKEDSLWFPTCTMANMAAVLLQTSASGSIVTDSESHLATTERDGIEGIAKRRITAVSGNAGVVPTGRLSEILSQDKTHELVTIEDTHNRAGGIPLPLGYCESVGEITRSYSVKLHLDGARLFNAAVAHGVAPAELCVGANTVSISLNKGLGAPNGALLAGPTILVERAVCLRQQLGGGMRPLNMMAAAGRAALNQWKDVAFDHVLALQIAEVLAGIPNCNVDHDQVQTNIILVRLPLDSDATSQFLLRLKAAGVLALAIAEGCIRLCVHRGLAGLDVQRIADTFADVVRATPWQDLNQTSVRPSGGTS